MCYANDCTLPGYEKLFSNNLALSLVHYCISTIFARFEKRAKKVTPQIKIFSLHNLKKSLKSQKTTQLRKNSQNLETRMCLKFSQPQLLISDDNVLEKKHNIFHHVQFHVIWKTSSVPFVTAFCLFFQKIYARRYFACSTGKFGKGNVFTYFEEKNATLQISFLKKHTKNFWHVVFYVWLSEMQKCCLQKENKLTLETL